MQQPYRQAANPENNAVPTMKKNVGKITVQFYYTDKDDKVVCKELVYVGEYNGWLNEINRPSFRYADNLFHNLLSFYRDDGVYYLGDDLLINRSRMIEMRVKKEEYFVEHEDETRRHKTLDDD